MRLNVFEVKLLPLFFLLMYVGARGQHFTQTAVQLGVDVLTSHNHWGCGVSFYDWDKDGWPDLSFSRLGVPPAFFKNNQGTFEAVDFGIPNTNEGKMVVWVDYDNDGDADLFITRYLGHWSLYQNDGDFNFTDVTASVGIFQVVNPLTYGASWGDINNDGWLDLYISCYNTWVNQPGTTITNYLFQSNGDGTFTEVGAALGVDNGSKHTFQTTFLDFNRDGWQDIYVANDRLPDSNDLYLNNGDGTFTNITNGSGADVYLNTMGNVVGDYDNDGDLDLYVANSHAGNAHLRNNGNNTFTNVASEVGTAVNQFCWSGMWLDYDLDGWKDLVVPTGLLNNVPTQNYLYTNNGDGNYTYAFLSGLQGHLNVAHCTAVGDYNNDGKPDIAFSVRAPLKAELWRNNMPDKNYLKVQLQGVISNRDGIGSFIDCYAGGIMQTHYTMCGESFMGQNSQYYHFGLSNWEVVDSLKITWLSGIVDVLYNVNPNQVIEVIEGSTLPGPQLNMSGFNQFCEGQTVELFVVNDTFSSYQWMDSISGSHLIVSSSGEYYLQAVNSFGLVYFSEIVTIEFLPLPLFELIFSPVVCSGNASGFMEVGVSEGEDLVWFINGVETELPVGNLEAGVYEVMGSHFGCQATETVVIESVDPIEAVWSLIDIACHGENSGAIELEEVQGGAGVLTFNPSSEDWEGLIAGSFTVEITDEVGCSVLYQFELTQPEPLEADIETTSSEPGTENGSANLLVIGGTPPYATLWSDGSSDTFQLEQQGPGIGWVIITDAWGCQLTVDYEITTGVIEFGQDCTIQFANGAFRINCGRLTSARLYSVSGQLMDEVNNPSEWWVPAIHADGIYILKLGYADGSFTTTKFFIH